MAMQLHKQYVLGEFELEPDSRRLSCNGEKIHLTKKPFGVLLYLIENRERMVSRQELLENFWDGHEVYEETLTKCIGAIRKALNDNTDKTRFIQTHWAEGYRFIGEVEEKQSGFEIERIRGVKITVEETDEPEVEKSILLPEKSARRNSRFIFASFALLIIAVGLGAWYWQKTKTTTAPIQSIAVLPLENLSGDASQDYFADGMTDAVITELAKIENLRVISRSSTIQYKGTRKKIAEIANELNVDAVVVGTVLRSGDKVRIATQMFRASNDQNIWSNSYERDIRDVLALQSEVSRGIVSEIKIKLSSEEKASLSRELPVNPEAQDAYLKGLFYWHQAVNFTGPREEHKALFFKSFEFFQQAINIEPNNAQAHASLAAAYHWYGSMGNTEYFKKSKEAALIALRLDETNPTAHGALGYVLWRGEWKIAEAEKEMRRVIELNPNDNRHGLALLLSSLGSHDEALKAIEIGEPLDPLNIAYKENIVWILTNARKFDLTEKRSRSLIEVNPNNTSARRSLARSLSFQGRHQEAIAEILKFIEQNKGNPSTNINLAWHYAIAGQRGEAVKILDEAAKQPDSARRGFGFAAVYSLLGEKDAAFVWLEKAFAEHAPAILDIKAEPSFDNLRDDPRFQDILRRVGFPQ